MNSIVNEKELFLLAKEASQHAWAPYSGFKVGAALLTDSGEVYQGANIENASYGATICAERTAMVKALYDGHRSFSALAIYSQGASSAWPCGICRQFIFEFSEKARIITGPDEDHLEFLNVDELLPYGFRLKK